MKFLKSFEKYFMVLGLVMFLLAFALPLFAQDPTAGAVADVGAKAALMVTVVPIVTAGIRWAWSLFKAAPMPFWMSPFRSLAGGFIVSKLSAWMGVQLPGDLSTISDTTTAMIIDTVFIGGGGHLFSSFLDKLQRDYPNNKLIGKVVSLFLRNVANPKSIPAPVPKAADGNPKS